jgi:hypothetical protein
VRGLCPVQGAPEDQPRVRPPENKVRPVLHCDRVPRDLTKASLPWRPESILAGDLYAVISILVIIVRHFQEQGAGQAVPDLPKTVKVPVTAQLASLWCRSPC